jgi:CRP-like cAMP-binding protein
MLHAILFPVNALRLLQFQRLVRDIRNAHREDLSIRSLLPYMKQSKRNAGEILFRKGDKADSMYYLMDGELEITDFNKSLTRGAVVGEVGVFSRSQLRTATVKCRTDGNLFELTERKVKELYFQDRSFGFALLQLIIARLIENSERTMQPAIAVASAKGIGQSA